MVIDIEPVKLNGQFWINVIIGGHQMTGRGPLPDAATAELVAEHMRRRGRALTSGGGNYG